MSSSASSSNSPDESRQVQTAVKSAVWRCPRMSRDKRGNRTQEVVGSIPISSTNSNVASSSTKKFARSLSRRRHSLACLRFPSSRLGVCMRFFSDRRGRNGRGLPRPRRAPRPRGGNQGPSAGRVWSWNWSVESLMDRPQRGPILAIGSQIADRPAAAHEAGIVSS